MATQKRKKRAGSIVCHGEVVGRVRNRDGSIAVDNIRFKNAATVAGMNYLAETGFRSGTAVANWYVGLIAATGFTALDEDDTAGSHAGWTEATWYNEATRRQWSPTAAAGGLLEAAILTFTNSSGGSQQVRGIFVVSVNTKGGSTGTLWATAAEESNRTIGDGQTFEFYYRVQFTAN
jgi:hypothetical protein